MNPRQIISEAARRGLKLSLCGCNLVVSSAGVRPHDFLKEIRANKADIVIALKAEKSEKSEIGEERLGLQVGLPPGDLPLPASLSYMSDLERAAVTDWVIKQGKPAIGWCLTRANAYFLRFPQSSFEEQDAEAGADLLAWQTQAMRTKAQE
jgi:hypothetical protein